MKKSASKSKTSSKKKLPSDGLLVVLSAPSGAGKTTVVDRLLKRHPDWVRSISATTREPREGEKDGEDYFFVTPKKFSAMKTKDQFLESAKVFSLYYGTPKPFVMEQLKHGRIVLLAIDIQGAKQIRRLCGKTVPLVTIFILPPSVKILRERLEGRKTDSLAEIEKRLKVAQEEIKAASQYDITVVNQNLEQTIVEVEDTIENARKKWRK